MVHHDLATGPPPGRFDDDEEALPSLDGGPSGATIHYRPETIHEHEREAVEALASRPGLFARSTTLVRLATGDDPPPPRRFAAGVASEDDAELLRGGPRIVDVTAARLRVEMSSRMKVCHPRTKDGETTWRPGRVPDDLVRAVLERGAWPGVPELIGIAEAPFLRPDGSVCKDAGFDPPTGILHVPTVDVDVKARPSREDARRALDMLEGLFADFPHVTRAHRMVPIAALLSLLARHAIRGNVPAFLFDAATRGSGKTLQTDCVSLIATGRASPKMAWPHDETELSKVLAAVAVRASPMVNFDNVATTFGGQDLDRCLTAGTEGVAFRVLGITRTDELPWRSLILASGNNLAVTGDTTRRVLVARLESADEHPELRADFRLPDLMGHVRRHRAELVSAGLTILRAYHVAGRPDMRLRPWGSFESFASLVPPAMVFAAEDASADVMACRLTDSEASVDPEKAFASVVLEHWLRLLPKGGTAKDALRALYPPDRFRRDREPSPPDGFDELRDAIEGVTRTKPGSDPSPHALGKALQRIKGRVVSTRRLHMESNPKGAARWSVEST
jgi:hypothetical protein